MKEKIDSMENELKIVQQLIEILGDDLQVRDVVKKYTTLKQKYKRLDATTKIQIDNLISANDKLKKRLNNAMQKLEKQ